MFLKGDYDPEDFSYDYPDKMIEHEEEIINKNNKVYDILQEDILESCAFYEPSEAIRKTEKGLLNEKEFKQIIETEYKKICEIIKQM